MEYARLPGTGLEVSRICLGTMTFGDQVDEKGAADAVAYAMDRGVNFIDTANGYAGGKSEEIVGKAIAGRRGGIVLATKVGTKLGSGPNESGLSRSHILKELENSLRRLGTDYVDIYYLHTPDRKTPIGETLETMSGLVRSGKVRYIGTSNYAAWELCRMRHKAKAENQVPPALTQVVYNLITRGIERELVPFLGEYRMGMIVYNPLAGGLLTAKYAAKKLIDGTRLSRNRSYNGRYWNEDNLRAWDDFDAIARKAALSMPQLAYRWLFSTGCVDSVISGFSNPDQLRENLAAAGGGKLSPEVMADCDAAWSRLAGSRFQYNR